jgi:hypothetical protein
MVPPTKSVTLSVQQVEELSRHFSSFRHDVNGCLSLIVAATELIRYNPAVLGRMSGTIVEQPPRIAGKVSEFLQQCERTLGLRHENGSWYALLWKRVNAAGATAPDPVAVGPDDARALQGEWMAAQKEILQLGFTISGAQALLESGQNGPALLVSVQEQFTKAAGKFDQVIARFEQVLAISEGNSRRLASGTPTADVTLAPDEVELFHRRLTNLRQDIYEHLGPLIELAGLVRTNPGELTSRAADFAAPPPAISAAMQEFGVEFDRIFKIDRT